MKQILQFHSNPILDQRRSFSCFWRDVFLLVGWLPRLLSGAALFLLLGASSAYAGHTVVATVGVGSVPHSVWVNPVTNRVYVSNEFSNNIMVLDGATNTVLATVATGSGPVGEGVNTTTNRVYIANANSNNVTVLDGSTNTVIATVAVGSGPNGVAVNSVTNKIYVANAAGNTVSVIDGATNTVTGTVPVVTEPTGVAVNSNINRVYVTNFSSNTLKVLDGASDAVIATVGVGTSPVGVAVDPASNKVYVANTGSSNISVVDGATNAVVGTIAVGGGARGVAVNSLINRIYVANTTANTVSVLDGNTYTLLETILVGSSPWRIAVNQATARVYVTNNSAGTVSVIANNDATPQTGWWWNPSQSGLGFMIERQGNKLLIVAGYYDSDGRATWYYSYDGTMTGTSYAGPLTVWGNGQTLTGSYVAPTPPTSLGTISLSFSDAAHGTVTMPGGAPMAIERFNIVPGGVGSAPASFQPETGSWWNAGESGRGFAVEIQNGQMFMAGYMYNSAGKPIWYTSGGTMVAPSVYQGNWMQWANGPTLGGAYVAPIVINANVGNVTLTFSSETAGTLTLPDGRSIPLTRFFF